ncbi:MAG: PaaI family thioesterase [Alcanivorax sp.]|jgi:uncharacterized protein (TIGR00369 family)|nr:PaaI family thioesterase [Alcanivorax sp.]
MNDHTALLNRIRQVSALAPFNQWMDLRVEHAEAGQVILRLDWRDDFAQYNGHLHAALIGGLIDTACGFAAGTVAGNVTASQFSVRCLRPAVARTFRVTGRVVKAGKRQVFASATLGDWDDENGEPFAVGDAVLVPLPERAG